MQAPVLITQAWCFRATMLSFHFITAIGYWLFVRAHLQSHQQNSHEIRARSKCVVEIW